MGIFGSSALLAFSLEFSEFLLVSNTSSLTLSVSGIFKVGYLFHEQTLDGAIAGNCDVVFGGGIQ